MGFSCCRIDRDHRGLRGDPSRQADRACTPRSDSGRSAAEDGGRRLFCFAMQSVRHDFRESVIPVIRRTRRKIAAERRCGPGPLAASVAHSEGRGRGPFRQNGKPHRTGTARNPAHQGASPSSGRLFGQRKPAEIPGRELRAQIRPKTVDAEAAEIVVEVAQPG